MSKALSRWKTLGFCLVAVLCLTIVQEPVLGETFYVAPDGDDNNPGTIAEPLATLVGARDRVRKVLDGSGDITVYLRGGTYHLSKTVVFGLEDSGSENQKITYVAYKGEKPVFTSGARVTGWRLVEQADGGYSFLPQKARGKVYAADIPAGLGLIRNLVDGSSDWLDKARIGMTDSITTRHFKHCKMVESEMWDPPQEKKVAEFSKSLEGLSNTDTALELRLYTTDYNMNLLPVASIDGNKLTTQVPGTYRLSPPPPHHRPWKGLFEVCWIENVLEGLDEPGEWVCNMRTGRIYLWPKSGTSDIYAPGLAEFIRVEGDIDYWGPSDKPVKYITFDGLTFTNGRRATWEEGDAGVQHDWAMCDKANALLRFRGAENCEVRNCTFRKSGGVGVRFDLHAQNNIVENCLFEYLGDEAVHFGGYGIGTKDVNKNNKLLSSEIHHVGQIKWDGAAVMVWNSGFNRIAGNYIHHCTYKAVLLSAPRSRAFTKEYPMREQGWPMARWKEVDKEAWADVKLRGQRRVSTSRDDVCSGFRYTQGNVVEKNTLHDMSEGMWGDGIFYVTATAPGIANKIISNYIYNTDGNSERVQSGFFRGVYLDSFIGNVDVHKNIWYNCEMIFEGNHFAISRERAYPRANVFYNVSCENLLEGRRFTAEGTLVYGGGEGQSELHKPKVDYLEDYIELYHNLCPGVLPGVVEGAEKIQAKLADVITEFGGTVPVCGGSIAAGRFEATGPSKPVKMEENAKAVEVYFDLVPTMMRFILPAFPCMVTENNIQYSNFFAETYEPRAGGGSFETAMDDRNTYARMWIQSQNDARIIVRVRGALSNSDDVIAHTDIESGSPYGKGDWVDEWFYIYPDGVHVRHVKIYTGLASRSRPFGFDREPPAVVHEFMEAAVIGAKGHTPLDDIEIGGLTLIKMVGGHSENVIPGGASKTINFKPYPDDFGDFRDANIMVVNLKSRFKPFTIGLPYGVRIQPYSPEDDLPYVFQTWGNPPEEGYVTAFGHILNFWHYRRTDNTLEQVYLQGLTDAKDPAKELVPLAWSWIAGPKLRMEGLKPDYKTFTYDQSQKAYVLSCKDGKGSELEFELEVDEDFYDIGQSIINPAIVVKGWGKAGVALKINDKPVKQGRNFRVGYEKTNRGTDLVVWLKVKSTESILISISPVDD